MAFLLFSEHTEFEDKLALYQLRINLDPFIITTGKHAFALFPCVLWLDKSKEGHMRKDARYRQTCCRQYLPIAATLGLGLITFAPMCLPGCYFPSIDPRRRVCTYSYRNDLCAYKRRAPGLFHIFSLCIKHVHSESS